MLNKRTLISYLFISIYVLITPINSFAEGTYELKDKNAANPDIYVEHPSLTGTPQRNSTLRRLTVLWVDILNADEVIDIYTSRYEGTTDIQIWGANDTTVSVFTYNVLNGGDGYVANFTEIVNAQNISTRPRAPVTFVPAQGLGSYKIVLYGLTTGNDANGIRYFDIAVRNTKGTATQIDDIIRRGRLWSKHLALSSLAFTNRMWSELYMVDGEDMGSYYEGYLWKGDMNGIAPYGFHMFTNRVGSTNLPNQSVAGGGVMVPQYQMYFNYPEKSIINPILPTVSNLVFRNNCPGSGGYFEFTTNGDWTFEIVIDENNDGIYNRGTERTITGPATVGFNSIYWDGKLRSGADAPPNFTATTILRTKSSEIHFPFFDVENQPGATGPIFNLVPFDNETSERYYWNDLPVGGTDNSALGSLSYHVWNNAMGNNNLIDTWKVAFEDVAEYTLSYNCFDANLDLQGEVDVPRPDEGSTIHYKFYIQNTGPADADNIDITFNLPVGLTFVSATASIGTYTNPTQIWNISSLPIGELDSLLITTTVNAGTAGQQLSYSATITAMDQTDPDLTNNTTDVLIDVGRFNISGYVFEDKNFGGGAGRNSSASGAEFLQNVQVELYDASDGSFIESTTTNVSGYYVFEEKNSGDYYVRVVNSTVKSRRVGGTLAGNLAVQTFRSDASTGTAIAVTNKVGGEIPNYVDAPANSGSQNISVLTSGTQTPQSVTPVTLSFSDINNVNFGFNFSTIVNTNDSGQGSLRQFVINSNQLANFTLNQSGLSNVYEYSIFNIPTSDPNFNGSTFRITLSTALPDITDSFTRFDGSIQTAYTGNTNMTSLGVSLGPEIIVDGAGFPAFRLLASYTYITELGIEGVTGAGTNGSGILMTGSGSTGAVLNILTITGNSGSGIYIDNGASSNIVEYSYIISNGVTQADAPGITIVNSSNIVIRNNLIRLNSASGIALFSNSNNTQIEYNSIENNGNLSATYQSGLQFVSVSNATVTQNIFRNNNGDGVQITAGTGNRITENSFYSNNGLGIDLVGSNGVNLNDSGDGDTGPNNLLNFPVLTEARIDGANFTVSGYARPSSLIEIYIAEVDPTNFGEGKTFLFSETEGSGNDNDATTGAYSGIINGYNSGTDNTNKFSFSVPIPSGINLGTRITTIAIDGSGNTSEFSAAVNVVRNGIKGYVYLDDNHNFSKDGTEAGLGVSLYVKLLNGTTIIQSAVVDPGTGLYSLSGISSGTYNLILDTNNLGTDAIATAPATYVGTEAPNQLIGPITVGTYDNLEMNFGLFRGAKIEARVLEDNGIAGAAAYNGSQDGSEPWKEGVAVKVTNSSGASTIDESLTDANGLIQLWVPHAWNSQSLKITATAPTAYIAVSGNVGNTSGTLNRDALTVSYTNTSGSSYSGVILGIAQYSRWEINMIREALSGTSVLIPHVFTANSKLALNFTISQTSDPSISGWTVVLYRDLNSNSQLEASEPIISGNINLLPNEQVHVIAKVTVPNNAPVGASSTIQINANTSLTGTSPLIPLVYQITDLVNVNNANSAGLELIKTVNKTTALPGETLLYTITYRNISTDAINTIVINDATPTFTTFSAAAFGTLPQSLTNCVITSPTVGSTGAVVWTFTGSLLSGAQGSVSYEVIIDN